MLHKKKSFFVFIGLIRAISYPQRSAQKRFSMVQTNIESSLLLQISPETSSIWAFFALLYPGEVAVAEYCVCCTRD
jgi:hypothetical protein